MEDSGLQFELNTDEAHALVIEVRGRVDGLNADEFRSRMQENIQSQAREAVILDFEGLAYISSAGLRVILLLADTLNRRSQKLVLCALPQAVLDIVQATGFDNIVDVYMSRKAAMDAVAQ